MNCTEFQLDLATIVEEISNLGLLEIEEYESYCFGCNTASDISYDNTIESSLVKRYLWNYSESNDPKENELSIKNWTKAFFWSNCSSVVDGRVYKVNK